MKNALTARMLLAGAVTNWSIFLPGAYQTFLAMHIAQNISDANDRRYGGGRGRQNTPIRQLKGEQRMAGEEKLVRMILIVYSSLYHHVVCF